MTILVLNMALCPLSVIFENSLNNHLFSFKKRSPGLYLSLALIKVSDQIPGHFGVMYVTHKLHRF